MPTTARRRTLEDMERLATEIFERKVKPTLRPEDHGKFVAVDVDSEAFEIDQDDYTAVMRLRSRKPGADGWLMRAGYPTAYRMGKQR